MWLLLSLVRDVFGGCIYTWGNNDKFQLGQGSNASSGTPVRIPDLMNVTQMALDGEHSAALLSNGSVLAWGDNSHGQLGLGHSIPVKSPVLVPGLSNVTQIALGDYHSAALL